VCYTLCVFNKYINKAWKSVQRFDLDAGSRNKVRIVQKVREWLTLITLTWCVLNDERHFSGTTTATMLIQRVKRCLQAAAEDGQWWRRRDVLWQSVPNTSLPRSPGTLARSPIVDGRGLSAMATRRNLMTSTIYISPILYRLKPKFAWLQTPWHNQVAKFQTEISRGYTIIRVAEFSIFLLIFFAWDL